MRSQFFLSAILASASVVSAHVERENIAPKRFHCGVEVSVEQQAAAAQKFQEKLLRVENFNANTTNGIVDFPVHFHIISEDGTEQGGNITDDAVDQQMTVLNDAYQGSNVTFTLVNTTRTINGTIFQGATDGNALQDEMKQMLHTGNASVLNIYSTSLNAAPAWLPQGYALIGYATFPWDYEHHEVQDGVVINYATIPGTPASVNYGADFGTGKNAAHEVGHWLGLYHPFQGNNCYGKGDEVDDTPAQSTQTDGDCPVGKDSCPFVKGDDNINNFMDYSSETCKTLFTDGQFARIANQTQMYRS